MKINKNNLLLIVFFANFSFSKDFKEEMDQLNKEAVKSDYFKKAEGIEKFIENSKIKRFFLQPVGFVGQAMNNFMNILEVTSFGVPLRKDHLMDSINLYTYFKRFSNKKNSEIMNKKFLSTIVFLESLYRIRLLYRLKFAIFSKGNVWNYIYLIDQLNNLAELYLKGMNLVRAFKK